MTICVGRKCGDAQVTEMYTMVIQDMYRERETSAGEIYQLQGRCFATSVISSPKPIIMHNDNGRTDRESDEGGAGLNGVCR